MCFQKTNIPIIPIFLPNSNKGGNHGKMNLLSRIIRKVQANKNSKEINCASYVSNLGFRDISMLKGRHTTLKYSLNTRKREWRKKYNLSSKKKGMKQHKENPTPHIGKNLVL